MSIAVRRYWERSRLAQGMVEDWQLEHRQAMISHDVEEFAQECIELAALTKRAWNVLLVGLFDDERCNDPHLDDLCEMMKNALAKTRLVFDAVQTWIAETQRKGYVIANAEEMQSALRDIRKIEEDIDKMFPIIDEEMVKRAQEAFARGECISAEDLLREAQGYGST
jgi:hypothetical protein